MAAIPVCQAMCATCPFREGSPYAYLVEDLKRSSLETSRICHSTGKNNAIHRRTGKPERICRGSRNFQIQIMHRLGVITEPTDNAWNEALATIQSKPK